MQLAPLVPRFKLAQLHEAPLFLGGAFAFLIIVVLASTALLGLSQRLLDEIDAGVRIQQKANDVLVLLRRMESGQRGYLLTGDEDFASSYRESVPLIPQALADLNNEIKNNPEQERLWTEMEPLVRKKLDEMAETFRLYESGDRDAALNLVRSEAGLRYMEDIRGLTQNMRDIQARQLGEHYRDARRQEWLLIGVNLAAISLIIIIGFISILIVRRANTAMAKAQAVLRDANAELEANVAARTAELKQANEEIQKFAYIVSHDLRSPLVNIMGFTSELETLKGELLGRLTALQQPHSNGSSPALNGPLGQKDQVLADDFDEALSFIKASITKMDRLINAVLVISREGNRTLRPEEVDMNSLLTNMSDAMAHQAQEADARIDIGPLPSLTSDRLALEQIFSNLLDNALKYLRPDTAGHIRVKGRTEGNKVVIEVEDNGRGIEPKDRERVFELFRRAGPQDKPGEGMGLAHVRALVRRLGGVITVKSTPGEGSTFVVTLPRAPQSSSRRMSA